MSHSRLIHPELFGLYELALDGTVLFYKANAGNDSPTMSAGLVGRNFFTEIANFENVAEFRRRFENFIEGRQSVDNFTVKDSRCESQKHLRVMLVRLGEAGCDGRKKFVLADIRQA